MKRKILFFCFIFGFGFLFGQQANIILNSPHNGNLSYTYDARDYISLEPNFSYSPVGSNFFDARINEDMVIPVVYADDPIYIDERVLDFNLPVGTTAGSQSVSLTGAATYQVTLVIPPGTVGMEPGVSLVYSSQAGNGLLGYGWNLAGLSAISRAGHTIYHDGDIKGVDFNDDRFLLDGNRLIVTAGDYGAPLSEYFTETFNASKITAHGTAGDGPEYFIVETKDGKTIYFGNTPDSRFIAQGRTDVLVWNINRIEDRLGNYIEFEYHQEGQTQQWIKEIRYTGNGDMEPYNSIHFYYSERDDKQLTYIAGSKVEQKVILDKIKVFAGNSLVRKYSLKYYFDFYSHLIELKEFNSLGETYNSTVFEWGCNTHDDEFIANDLFGQNNKTKGFEKNSNNEKLKNSDDNYEYEYFSGDYDGDGKTDLLQIEYIINTGIPLTNQWILYENQSVNNDVLYAETINPIASKSGNTVIKAEQFCFGDLNGDGLSDILELDNNASISQPSYEIHCYFSKPGDLSYEKRFIGELNLGEDYGIIRKMDIVEVNGDGLADILFYCKPYNQDRFKPFILISNGLYQDLYHVNYNEMDDFSNIVTSDKDKIKFADFDADGMNEILVLDENGEGFEIYSYDKTTNSLTYDSGGSSPDVDCSVFTGDFNGDGNSDLLYFNADNQWKIKISTGVSFIEEDAPITHSFNPEDIYVNYVTGDFNGDGKDDIWESRFDYSIQKNQIFVYYSKGNSFDVQECVFDGMLGPKESDYLLADWNGDGKTDLLSHYNIVEPHLWAIHFRPLDPSTNMAHTIADGFNNKVHLEYKPITYGGNLYSKSVGSSFILNIGEIIDYQGSLYVVSTKTLNNGIGGESEFTYNYQGAKIHKYGKGFLGFSKMITYDISNDAKTENDFITIRRDNFNKNATLNFFYYAHVLEATKFFRPFSNLISETSYIYNVKCNYDDNELINLSYIQKTTSINHLQNNLSISSDDVVDDFGNIITETIDYNGEGSKTTTTSYTDDGSWCNWLPVNTTVQQQRGNKTPFETETEFIYYSGDKGLLHEKISFNNLPLPVSEFYTYDDFGNITSVSTEPTGEMVPRVISYDFDGKGRFITSKTNILGQESIFTYDDKTGNILTSTDIQNLTTSYQYDGFGRNIKTTFPDGNKSNNSIHWFTENPGGNILYYTENITDGAPMQRTYFDELGRECIGASQHYNTNMVCRMTNYNANGKIESVSEPYFERAVPTQWTTYEYDEQGRPAEITYPASTVVYAYDGTTTTVTNTNTGVSTSNTIDAFGLTVSATDPGGTIGYDYYSSGLPKIITAPDGSEFTMDYDDYGRQTELNDPDAGLTTYDEYNGFGELKKQTDANGNVINTEYDDFGRPHIKWDSDGLETTYTYVEVGNDLGQIASVQQNNGIGYYYQYDRFGRMVNEQEIIGGQSYETGYTYDNFGNTENITYPSGFAVYNTYNRGYLSEVYRSDNNTLLYSNPVYNVRGQLTDYDIGNGLHTHKGYDDYGFPNSIITGTIQNLTFNFNPSTGNLNLRSDNNFSLTEHFGYNDALKNRLTNWVVGSHPNSASYQTNGNTAFKSDIGTYHYEYNMVGGTGGPHSVTKISDPIIIPDENNQIISYNAYNKVEQIQHQNQGYEYNITYGPDQARKKTEFKHNGNILKTKYYSNGYEKETSPGDNVWEVHYISGGDGLLGLYIIENGTGAFYYVHKDYLGSLYALTDETGNIATHNGQQQIFSFDPWGRRRNPTNWTFTGVPTEPLIDRGFAGHKHLDEFGLINMNGRMYDPLLGRMLSPDNYVQAPDNSQNFNRYSYALNNPLIYSDPSGEFLQIPFFAMAFSADYLSNLINGVHDPLGTAYNNATSTITGINTCLQVPVYHDKNTIMTAGISPLNLGINANIYHTEGDFTFSSSVGIGLGGPYVNSGVSYSSGKWAFGVSGGGGSNFVAIGGSLTYDGYGFGYSSTHYGNASGPCGYSCPQTTGRFNLYFGDVSFGIENDFFAFNHQDRGRTSAWELQINEFSIGSYIYTNDPYNEGSRKYDGESNTWGFNQQAPDYRAWENGKVYSSPLYFGYRNGNTISRMGYSDRFFQDAQQNGLHQSKTFTFGNQNYYLNYDEFRTGLYVYSGFYNPYSLFGF